MQATHWIGHEFRIERIANIAQQCLTARCDWLNVILCEVDFCGTFDVWANRITV